MLDVILSLCILFYNFALLVRMVLSPRASLAEGISNCSLWRKS